MLAARNINTEEYSQPTKKIERYSKISHRFIQKSKLSVYAKQLIIYLDSQPSTWIPRPADMKKHLMCSDRIWRRVRKELKEGGFLRLKSGGNGRGGSQLEFDPNGRFREDHFEGSEKITVIHHINNNSISKQYNNKTTTTPTNTTESPAMKTLDANVVVTLVNRMKGEVGLTERDIQQLLSLYPIDQIIEKLGMLKTANAENPIGWFKAALQRNFPSRKPKPLTTGIKSDDTEQMKHVHESHLKGWKDRGYEDSMTDDQKRQAQAMLEKIGPHKRDGRRASI